MKRYLLAAALFLMVDHLYADNIWQKLSPLPEPAAGFAAGKVGKHLILAGGTNWTDGTKRWLDTIWRYDPAKDQWTVGPKLPNSLAYAAFASDGEHLYVAGGADGKQARREVLAIDEAMNVKVIGALPEAVVFAGGALQKGMLHVFGGTPDPDHLDQVHAHHAVVDLKKGVAIAVPNMLAQGAGLPAVVAARGQVMAFTGVWMDAQQQVQNLDLALCYDGSWQPLAPYPMKARGVAAVTLADKYVYLAGGYGTDEEGFLTEAWLYHLDAKRYLPAVKLPLAATTCLVVCDEHVYVLGGEDQKKHRTDACFCATIETLMAMP